MKQSIIFAGKILPKAICGESMKNHIFIDRLKSLYKKVLVIETHDPKHHPQIIINLLSTAFLNRRIPLIISCSSRYAYFYIKLLNVLRRKNNYYWVIGGNLHKLIENGTYKAKVYRKMAGIFVESHEMVDVMQKCGLSNVHYCPNFKNITHIPDINKAAGQMRFVFLSRIIPEKGCSMILNCVEKLNKVIDHEKFDVTFYGPIDSEYKETFYRCINSLPNANYAGFLDLTKKEGYDELAKYSVMLFPTWWPSEGFPGIVIDAYISGLPVIASDWNFNKELIDESTGWIIPAKNEDALYESMHSVLHSKNVLEKATSCQKKAKFFSVNNVITSELMDKII